MVVGGGEERRKGEKKRGKWKEVFKRKGKMPVGWKEEKERNR